MKKLIYILAFILCFASYAYSACSLGEGYDDCYYFDSVAGGGTTCSEGSPCATYALMKTKIDTRGVNEEIGIMLKDGSEWSANSATATQFTFVHVENDNPIVHFEAYPGTGAKPIFNGQVTDFSALDTGALDWPNGDTCTAGCATPPCIGNRLLWIERSYSTVKGIELKNGYGSAITFGRSSDPDGDYYTDNFVVELCEIHNFGYGFFSISQNWQTQNSVAQYNKMYQGQQIWRYGHDQTESPDCTDLKWGNGVAMAMQPGNRREPYNNIVRYNIIYDVAGEGIHNSCGTTEYNIIGDTASTAIHTGSMARTYTENCDMIIRHNLITMSGSQAYGDLIGGGSSHDGIDLHNEEANGYPINIQVEIYGNTIINRNIGLKINDGQNWGHAWGPIRIYNNTVINSQLGNIYSSCENIETVFPDLKFYNNASIFYGESDTIYHSAGLDTGFTHDKNLYYHDTGTHAINILDNGKLTGDPKLYGEDKAANPNNVDWSGLATGDPTADGGEVVNVEWTDIAYLVDSALVAGAGFDISTLGWGGDRFLSVGTDFDDVLDGESAFVTKQQTDGFWTIGAYLIGGNITVTIGTSDNINEECDDDVSPYSTAQDVGFSITSSVASAVKYEVKTTPNPCSGETYDTLATGTMTTGDSLAHTVNVSMNCSTTRYVCAIGRSTSPVEDSNSLKITLSVAAGGGVTPQPGMNIDVGGTVSIETGGTVSIE